MFGQLKIFNYLCSMKKLLHLLLILIILTSCEKEPLYIPCDVTYPTTQDSITSSSSSFLDGDWLLMGGRMYLENLDLDTDTSMFLFDSGVNSSLRLGGSYYDFEDIVRYTTVWSFNYPNNTPGIGGFVIDYDSLVPYGLSITSNNITVIENIVGPQQLGGSGRPLHYEIIDRINNTIYIYVQEMYENINGYNCYYYSKLKFKKL